MLVDLRGALRSLARAPGFLAGAVVTLGLGLGAVTTAFGLLAGALGEVDDRIAASTIVLYLTEQVDGREVRMRWPYAAVRAFRESQQSFDRVATYTTATLNATGASASSRLDIEFVSPAYFDVVGVRPIAGRVPDPRGNEVPGSAPEIVIGYAMWQRDFGGSPSAIGQTVNLAREPLTIAGVMPEGFTGLSGRASAFVPHTMSPRTSYDGYFSSEEYFHNVIARLAPGVDRQRAQQELALIASRMAATIPSRSEGATGRSGFLVPLSEARTNASMVRARTYVAIGAVLVLLVAGVNLANLVGARIGTRAREFGVRMAVGAGKLQVARTIGIEMAVVALGGFALAMVLAVWTRDLVLVLIPPGLASAANDYGQLATFSSMDIDVRVSASIGLLALMTMAGAGLVAARRSMRGDLVTTLRSGGDARATAVGGYGQRLLLVAQVAVSLTLVTSAGLILKSVSALGAVDPGFDSERLIAFSVAEDLAAQRPGGGPQLIERVLDGLRDVPGVEAISTGQCTPFGSRCARLGFSIEGRPETEREPLVTGWHRVGPDHFGVLRIPVIRGRGFNNDDRRGRAPVVVINQTAARRFFANEDPIGRRIAVPEVIEGDPRIAEIVGIVGDVTYWPFDEPPGPDVYQPALQFNHPFTSIMVRVTTNRWRASQWLMTGTQPVFEDLRRALGRIDPNLPMFDAVTIGDLARAGRADRRFVSLLLSSCALLALTLAAVGIYSLTAAWLQSRRREFAVRVALGADPSSMIRVVMSGALTSAAIGVVAGLALSLGAGRALQAWLFGIGPNDPQALMISAVVMLAVAAIAAWIPARRVTKINPIEQLRADA